MFTYLAYGLIINSELELPELLVSKGNPDVTIRLGKLTPPTLKPTNSECHCSITPEEAYLWWLEGGTFLVRGGREIIIDPITNVEEKVLRLFLLGAALGLLLHQRNLLVLHASSVAINGGAVAFIGESGMGKSTTAGALQQRGHRILSDDVTAVSGEKQTQPLIVPGFPQLKLWPEAAVSLGSAPETLPLLHPEVEKRHYCVRESFVPISLPLKCIYVLEEGEKLAIKPLDTAQALAELMNNWYCARFGTAILEAMGISWHFLKCTQLLNHVPIYYLQHPYSLSLLSDVAKLLEEHNQSLWQPAIV